MSDGARDQMAMAAARLEAAVERLTHAFTQARAAAPPMAEDSDMVPRAEVAAMADRLDAAIARLRRVLVEELRPDELRSGDHGPHDDAHGEPD